MSVLKCNSNPYKNSFDIYVVHCLKRSALGENLTVILFFEHKYGTFKWEYKNFYHVLI